MLQSTKINASSIALQLLFSWSRDCCNLFSESFGCNFRKTFLTSATTPPTRSAQFTAIIWIEMGKNAFRALVFTITHSLRRVYWYAWTVFSHSHYRDKVSFLRPVIAISPLLYLKHHHFTGRASAEMMGQKKRQHQNCRELEKHSFDCILHTFFVAPHHSTILSPCNLNVRATLGSIFYSFLRHVCATHTHTKAAQQIFLWLWLWMFLRLFANVILMPVFFSFTFLVPPLQIN